MRSINCHHSLMLLLVFIGWNLVQGQQRTSQAKCQDYRDWASSHLVSCNRPTPLITEDHPRAEDHPHVALLGWQLDGESNATYQFLTGGSLISDRYVLTVAHSPRNLPNRAPEVVRLGAVEWSDVDAHQVDYEIAEIIPHPKYNRRNLYNDIALVRLTESVRFSQYIRPACLWESVEMNFTSVEATIFVEKPSRKLQTVNLDISKEKLSEEGTRRVRLMDNQLHLVAHSSDICQGESGSPAHVTLDPTGCVAHVVGISSYRTTCRGWQQSEIYTRVASFIDWIEGFVWA